MQFDLLIKDGDVLDPGAGYRGKMDIAVKRDRIAAVDRSIPAGSAYQVIDASGLTLTPGLIDMHAHIYEGVSYFGINADAVGSQSGVRLWWMPVLRRHHLPGPERLHHPAIQGPAFAFINIACTGLVGRNYELSLNEYCSVDLLERVASAS
jgi:dihydroorotase